MPPPRCSACARSSRRRRSRRSAPACAVADRAFDRVPEFARPGRAARPGVPRFPGRAAAGGSGLGQLRGRRRRCPRLRRRDLARHGARPLAAGDVLMLDTGAVRDGYFCDFDRNFAIGPPPEAHAAPMRRCLPRPTRRSTSLRPGMLARDLHRDPVGKRWSGRAPEPAAGGWATGWA
jgi:hypothetical protein